MLEEKQRQKGNRNREQERKRTRGKKKKRKENRVCVPIYICKISKIVKINKFL